MRKVFKRKNMLAALLALLMLLGSFPLACAGDVIPEIPAAEAEALTESAGAALAAEEPAAEAPEEAVPEETSETPEEAPAEAPAPDAVPEEAPEAPEDIPAEAPAPDAVPEEAPEAPEEIPAETPAPDAVPEEIPETPEEIPAETPAPEAVPEETPEVPEEIPAETPAPEAVPEESPEAPAAGTEEDGDGQEAGSSAEASDGEPVVIDDDDAGTVSEELLDEFNNPETYETADDGVEVEIVLKNSELRYGEAVTLAALVSGEDMSFRIVWEASDGDARGWFTVGSGLEYTFTLTPGVVERAYRAVLFLVD